MNFDQKQGIDLKGEYAKKANISDESNPLGKKMQSTMSGTGMTQDATKS
jgi:hypothetical protein